MGRATDTTCYLRSWILVGFGVNLAILHSIFISIESVFRLNDTKFNYEGTDTIFKWNLGKEDTANSRCQ